MIDWTRISKLLGMVGSPHDGERLNAARLLQRTLESNNATFADLAARVETGGTGYVRERVIIKREKPNASAEIARKMLRTKRITMNERFFLDGIVRKSDYTGGEFDLTTWQADYLEAIRSRLRKSSMPMRRTSRAKSIPTDVLDDLGLGETPGTFAGPINDNGPMPDSRGESYVASGEPLGDDVLDALGLGTVQGTYVQPPVDHQKDVRERFGGLDLDSDVPF